MTSALVALATLTTTRAEAAVMSTPALRSAGSSSVSYACYFTNTGSKPFSDVVMSFKTASGSVFGTLSTVSVSPGETEEFIVTGAVAGVMHCTVSGKFSKNNAALSMQLLDGSLITRTAVEGR